MVNEQRGKLLMKKIISAFIILAFIAPVYAKTIEGAVSEKGGGNSHRIIDKSTGKGVGGAKITLPKENYMTKTNKDGFFELNTAIEGTSIMSVQKDKYKPFSMTINEKTFNKPLEVSIEKSDGNALAIDMNMHHLGDNSYSENSANAGEFVGDATGPFFTKKFNLKNINTSSPVYLVIGTIIGIDTLMARTMNQNRRPNAYATAPQIFFNGNKIADIQINGDGQKIKIPANLIRKNQINEVTIKTGYNVMQTSYTDYDDIEFMNLSIEN